MLLTKGDISDVCIPPPAYSTSLMKIIVPSERVILMQSTLSKNC